MVAAGNIGDLYFQEFLFEEVQDRLPRRITLLVLIIPHNDIPLGHLLLHLLKDRQHIQQPRDVLTERQFLRLLKRSLKFLHRIEVLLSHDCAQHRRQEPRLHFVV